MRVVSTQYTKVSKIDLLYNRMLDRWEKFLFKFHPFGKVHKSSKACKNPLLAHCELTYVVHVSQFDVRVEKKMRRREKVKINRERKGKHNFPITERSAVPVVTLIQPCSITGGENPRWSSGNREARLTMTGIMKWVCFAMSEQLCSYFLLAATDK